MASASQAFNFGDDLPFPKWHRASLKGSWGFVEDKIRALRGVFLGCIICATVGFIVGTHYPVSGARVANPKLPTQDLSIKEFYLNTTFVEAPSPETDRAWADLIPVGRGFVFLGTREHVGGHRGETPPTSEIRAVSVFHQIHCLNELRIGYYSGRKRNTPPHHDDSRAPRHSHSPDHMKHCFDYIRQSLMCAADATLEKLRPGADGGAPAVDGWGTKHTCNNYDTLYQWTQENSATDAGGIL